MLPEDVPEEPPTEVWEENWDAVMVFLGLGTQWRYSMNGPTGLDYASINPVMKALGVPKAERSDVFLRLMIMEGEALRVIQEQRKDK